MKNKNNRSEYEPWIISAREDLDLAKVTLSEQQSFFPAICFHAQQSAEKALKAFLYFKKDLDIPRQHSIELLIKLCSKHDGSFLDFRDKAKDLDAYYLPTRYPDALPGTPPSGIFNENEASDAIKIAQEILEFVENKIGKAI